MSDRPGLISLLFDQASRLQTQRIEIASFPHREWIRLTIRVKNLRAQRKELLLQVRDLKASEQKARQKLRRLKLAVIRD